MPNSVDFWTFEIQRVVNRSMAGGTPPYKNQNASARRCLASFLQQQGF
jgi:hypothetical protein